MIDVDTSYLLKFLRMWIIQQNFNTGVFCMQRKIGISNIKRIREQSLSIANETLVFKWSILNIQIIFSSNNIDFPFPPTDFSLGLVHKGNYHLDCF